MTESNFTIRNGNAVIKKGQENAINNPTQTAIKLWEDAINGAGKILKDANEIVQQAWDGVNEKYKIHGMVPMKKLIKYKKFGINLPRQKKTSFMTIRLQQFE